MGFPNPARLALSWIVHRFARARGFETIAPVEIQYARQNECDNCPASAASEGFQCDDCGCLLIAKRALAQEQCPRKKWGRVWILKK